MHFLTKKHKKERKNSYGQVGIFPWGFPHWGPNSPCHDRVKRTTQQMNKYNRRKSLYSLRPNGSAWRSWTGTCWFISSNRVKCQCTVMFWPWTPLDSVSFFMCFSIIFSYQQCPMEGFEWTRKTFVLFYVKYEMHIEWCWYRAGYYRIQQE